MTLTDNDIQRIAQTVDSVTRPQFEAIDGRLGAVEEQLNTLTTSVDSFLHIVRRHEEEWLVLHAQHARMRDALVKKGIVTEDEIAVA